MRNLAWLSAALLMSAGGCGQQTAPQVAASSGEHAVKLAQAVKSPDAYKAADIGAFSSASVSAGSAAAAPPGANPPQGVQTIAFTSASELIANNSHYRSRQRRLDALADNVASRDANGEAITDYRSSFQQRDGCRSVACVDAWFTRQEMLLSKWEGGSEILAQPLT